MTSARPISSSWRKSSYSIEENCVEVAADGVLIRVRDSKRPDGHRLTLTRSMWAEFIATVRTTAR
ncbi:DUF397 domain-containing protein [Cryptosporangium minutisporangium]|uniref:DUF397 domain-containing protein n=1 Tax=Cryptosporangium minutisporangium TaxID=113569 RepID=A0ABP6TA69_9ACTN